MTDLEASPPRDPKTGQASMATGSVARRASSLAARALTAGWIALMTQPAPVTSLVLAVVIELGGSLLRMLSPRARIIVLAMAACSIVMALALHSAAGGRKAPGELTQISMRSAEYPSAHCLRIFASRCAASTHHGGLSSQ